MAHLLLASMVTAVVAVSAAGAEPDASKEAALKAHFDPVIKDIQG